MLIFACRHLYNGIQLKAMLFSKLRLSSLVSFSFHHGRIIFIIAAVFVLTVPLLIKDLQFETTSASQGTADDLTSQIYVENQRRFGDSDTLIIYLEFSSVNAEVKNALTDSLQKELISRPDVGQVDTKPFDLADTESGAHLLKTVLLNSEPQIRQQFMAKFTESGLLRELRKTRKKLITLPDPHMRTLIVSDVLNIREIILPFYESRMGNFKFSYMDGYFDSEDGSARLIFVHPTDPSEDAEFSAEFLNHIDRSIAQIIGSMQNSDGIQYALTGKYSVIGESMQILKQDMRYITLVAMGSIFLLLFIAFRNVRAVFICFLPLCIAVLVVIVMARFLFNPLNYLALGFLAIILGLGVDVLLHWTGRFYQLINETSSIESTVDQVIKEAGPPSAIGLTTTAIAFLCLTFAKHPPLFQFGILTFMGLICILFISLILFPAAINVFGPKPGYIIKQIRFRKLPAWVGQIPLNKPVFSLVSVFFLLVISIYVVKDFSFDMDFFVAFPRNLESLETSRKVSDRFGQSFFLNSQLTLKSDDLEKALAAQKILDVELVSLIKAGKIGSFQSASLFHAYPHNEVENADLSLGASLIEKNKELFFKLLEELKFQENAVYETYLDMLKSAVSNDQENISISQSDPTFQARDNKFIVQEDEAFFLQSYIWPANSTEDYLPIEKSVLDELKGLELPGGTQLFVTGTLQVFEKVGEVVRSDFFRVSLLSLLVIPAVIFVFFRKVKNVLLCLLPLTAAIPMTLAIVVLTRISFSPFQIGVAAILIGIGIDDAVHILARTSFPQNRKIEDVLPEIGPVITLTSLSTMIGFGALIFSRNQAVSSMGVVITIGVLLSLIFTIILLPAALKIINRN